MKYKKMMQQVTDCREDLLLITKADFDGEDLKVTVQNLYVTLTRCLAVVMAFDAQEIDAR